MTHYRPWQWRKANREIQRLRNGLETQVSRNMALHTRCGIAEGWIEATADTTREIQVWFSLYKGPAASAGSSSG